MTALLNWVSLERGIVVGGVLVALGLGFLGSAVWKWSTVHFGSMSYPDSLRLVIPSVTEIFPFKVLIQR